MHWSALDDLQRIAAGQHSLFTTAQAAALGISVYALEQACHRRWLRWVRRSVYAFEGHQPSRWEPVVAAALAGGPSAAISHRAAAVIHGFWGIANAQPELTIPGNRSRRMKGVLIHRSNELDPDDVVFRSGVQITSAVRTLIDVAPSVTDYLLPRIIDEGSIARLWTPERIAERLNGFAERRRGTQRLRPLLAERMGEADPDSPLEQRVIRVLKPWLPAFEVHHRITLGGRIVELDVAWPEHQIAAEIDGRHVRVASRTKFDSDRLRSNLLEKGGWRVVHLTSGMDDLTLLAQLTPLFPTELIDRRIHSDVARLSPEQGETRRPSAPASYKGRQRPAD
jgi:very-short-patch-repair endonuclease